jgi:hypothetical protein
MKQQHEQLVMLEDKCRKMKQQIKDKKNKQEVIQQSYSQ